MFYSEHFWDHFKIFQNVQKIKANIWYIFIGCPVYVRINRAGFFVALVVLCFVFQKGRYQTATESEQESWRSRPPAPEGKHWAWAGRRWESGEDLSGGRGKKEVTLSAFKLLMMLWWSTPGYCLVHFTSCVPVDPGLPKPSQSMQGASRDHGTQENQHGSEERPQRLCALLLV